MVKISSLDSVRPECGRPVGEEEEEAQRERDMFIPVGNVKYWLGHGERDRHF